MKTLGLSIGLFVGLSIIFAIGVAKPWDKRDEYGRLIDDEESGTSSALGGKPPSRPQSQQEKQALQSQAGQLAGVAADEWQKEAATKAAAAKATEAAAEAERLAAEATAAKKKGPRAAAMAAAEAKAAKRAAELAMAEEQRMKDLPTSAEHPLAEALKGQARSEAAWQTFLERVLDWDSVEDREARRPQLKASKALARSAIERVLKRWGVTAMDMGSLGFNCTADELIAFFAERERMHQESQEGPTPQPTSARSPSSPAKSSRGRTPKRSASPRRSSSRKASSSDVKVCVGLLGEMRSSMAKPFLDGLALLDGGVDMKDGRLFIVVEAYDVASAKADILLYANESAAFSAVLQLGGEKNIPGVPPVECIERIALDDLTVMCDEWEMPRWNRSVSPQGSEVLTARSARGGSMPIPAGLPAPGVVPRPVSPTSKPKRAPPTSPSGSRRAPLAGALIKPRPGQPWAELIDPDNPFMTYFYNESTGESTYSRPAELQRL